MYNPIKDNSNELNQLVKLLSQYSIIESIAANIFPCDLYALAATAKTIHSAIFVKPESRVNLLKKMTCDGLGIHIRNEHHRKSEYFYTYNCKEHLRCGSEKLDQNVEQRPCVICDKMTCDECRIHCVYQSILQPATDPDELPNYSGFALLEEYEMGILSPAHLNVGAGEELQHWTTPHHDEGFLDIPLESSVSELPVVIDNLLDIDLGNYDLHSDESSSLANPSSITRAFCRVTEARKRSFCAACYVQHISNSNGKCQQGKLKINQASCDLTKTLSSMLCDCTLRKRFLDRWLCLKCYLKEMDNVEHGQHSCNCDVPFDQGPKRTLCLWCLGEVASFNQVWVDTA